MATVSWVVFKHHKKSDGTFNPKIRISHNGTSTYIATSIFTELVKFKKGASSGTVTSEKIKEELDDIVKEYRTIINENQSVIFECESSKDIIDVINRKKNGANIDFIEYARKYISTIKNEGTRTVKTTGINSLCHYLKATTGKCSLNIKSLTSNFLRKYESWLRSERIITIKQRPGIIPELKEVKKPPLNDTGIHSFMGVIQSVFNNALLEYNDYELGNIVIGNNPFKAYKIPPVLESKKRAVGSDIIKKLYDYKPINKRKRTTLFARDIYLLSFFLAGMNVADMLECHIVDGRIEYERKKTKDRRKDKAFTSVYIHPIAFPIIEQCKDKTGERVFDFYTRYKSARELTKAIHRGMKSLCEELKIEYMQFYSARHSFATIARNNCGISKDDIALCLNHSSGKSVTDTYIKPDFSRIDNVIRDVVTFIFGDNEKAGD